MFFFDLDGTLIDSNGIWKDVDRTFLARRGLPYTHAYYEGVAHTIFPLAAKFTKEFCHLSESCEDIMAVVTSSVPAHCRTALEHLDLARYFENVFFAHDLGLEKRDPAIWRKAAETCGAEPEGCTVFDDSLSACRGARAARMRVVGVYDTFFAQDESEMRAFCDVYIKSFEELLWLPEQKARKK